MTRPIPVIIGPTAVGKTDLGIAVARQCDAEVVSADSRQLYRHLDIGTAKPTAAQRQAVPHHLLDRLDPDERLDAARFVRLAWGCIDAIEARGRRPLIVGGSGMYVRALTDGLFPGPGAHPPLRAALEAEAQAEGVQALHDRLAAVDPRAAARIHPHDRVRIIRALEVYSLTGTPISQWQRQWQHPPQGRGFVLIGLMRRRDDLRRRIAARTQAMLSQGLEAEARRLLDMGFLPTLPPLQSVGYGEMLAYLAGEIDLPRARQLIERRTWRLAKRQMTWFRRLEGVHWLSLTEQPEAAVVEAITALLADAWAKRADGSSISAHPDQPAERCTCLAAT
jgi:tRNA dimethylallyltransferase